MLEIGSKAPDFTLLDKDNKEVSLHDFLGKKVILYFYPKDNTPGCTQQALGFKEYFDHFNSNNVIIIGISKDSTSSHVKFAEKYELPFILLSDPDHKVIELYDAWKEKSLYGKKYMGTMRDTYVIDENGIILEAEEKVKAKENACSLSARF